MYKIVGKDSQQYGPVTAEQLRVWITENRANAQTLTQAERSPEWKPLSAFPEFAAELKAAPRPRRRRLPSRRRLSRATREPRTSCRPASAASCWAH